MTEDSLVHTVSAGSIDAIKLAYPASQIPETKAATFATDATAANTTTTIDEQAIDWSDPKIPHSTLVKHRTGVGLAIVGTTFTIGGLAMIIGGLANNGQTTTRNTGYSTQTSVNIGPVGGIGILVTIAGLPMMISGYLKMAHSRKNARAALMHQAGKTEN
jgi:hypothetical protein